MIYAILNYKFMQYALLTCLLISVIAAIIGVFISEKKLVMLSGGVAHTAYGGVGLSFLIAASPTLYAFIFAAVAAIAVSFLKRRGGGKADVLIGLFWSLGMALGIIFVALTPGYTPDISAYLFGNILMVLKADLYLAAIVAAIICFIVFAFFNDWKSFLFDSEFFNVSKRRAALFEYALMLMVAAATVVLIKVAGIVLVMAVLTAPAASASLITSRLKNRIFACFGLSLFYCLTGLALSYYLNISSGAAIVFVSVLCFFALFAVKKLIRR